MCNYTHTFLFSSLTLSTVLALRAVVSVWFRAGMSGPADGPADVQLQQELNGAKRLAEFRLQKVIELQDEVVRLRRLLLTVRGGSEALQRAKSIQSRGASTAMATAKSRPEAAVVEVAEEEGCAAAAAEVPLKRAFSKRPKLMRHSGSGRLSSVTSPPGSAAAAAGGGGGGGSSRSSIGGGCAGRRLASPKPRAPSFSGSAHSVSDGRCDAAFQRLSVGPQRGAARPASQQS
ncbi:hypothetical protein DQ04_16861010, partial [Trypanosoma grayi]|uniref:hypothetical protein n=1 Tax=Trypanosoma grayi TaxID=71804 RepID=UPI0004F3F2B0